MELEARHRALVMRSNRLLGGQLVERNLVKIEDLESANERMLDLINEGTRRQHTVLGVLAYDLKVVQEEDILLHQCEKDGIGVIDLRNYEVHEEVRALIVPPECWATWTVPFDRNEDVTFVASAYCLSPAVKKFWADRIDGQILWFGTTLEAIADYLEALETKAPSPPKPAPMPIPAAIPPVPSPAGGAPSPQS